MLRILPNALNASECMSGRSKLSMLPDERRAQRHVWPNRLVGQMGYVLVAVVVLVLVVVVLLVVLVFVLVVVLLLLSPSCS